MTSTTEEISLAQQQHPRPLWLDILMEVGILAAVYAIYSISRGSIDASKTTALQHARDLMELEKTLGIFIEQDIQSVFLKTSLLTHIANIFYTICYYPAVILFAVWAYWRHRPQYKFMRTVFVISAIISIVVFTLYPMAPPRFFDGGIGRAENLGFVDTIADHWHANQSPDQKFYNAYAAMPSLHFGWALMVGIGIWWMTRSRWGRALGVLLPITMLVGVVSTANHFILDAVAGAIVLGMAFGLTALVFKLKGKREKKVESQT